jgi:hypothetical protein
MYKKMVFLAIGCEVFNGELAGGLLDGGFGFDSCVALDFAPYEILSSPSMGSYLPNAGALHPCSRAAQSHST